MDDLVTYLIVAGDDKTSVATAEIVTHRSGLHATVKFILEVRGVIVITRTLKTAKFHFGNYFTGNCSTPYAKPGTRVFGAEE